MKKLYLLSFVLCFTLQAQNPNTFAKFLDKNKVNARIHTVNNKFCNIFGNGQNGYEVPKGQGTHAQFANSIWIGGFDNQGKLHMSANTYRQAGADFWPGPLDTSNIGAFTPSLTAPYNKLWKVDCNEIFSFVNAFSSGAVAANTYTIPPDILTYPAKGLGKFQQYFEPFYDPNNNGQYNPSGEGDYPVIKGHQQILSIYNDNYAAHTEAAAPAMGLEIHERNYSYYDPNLPDSMKAVNYSTFHHYTIYNRSNLTYDSVFIADWSDVDLGGNYADDFVGTDTVNNIVYCYNGDNFDESGVLPGYGAMIPVTSNAILKTPCTNDGIDNDHDGLIDELGEQFIMNRSMYYLNNIGPVIPAMTNPDSAIHYYRFMNAMWKDGTPLTYGGNGYGGNSKTNYLFSGNPATNNGWTEASANNSPGDRRIIYSSGPFTFPAKSKIEWGYVVVYSQDTSQSINTITQFNSRVQRDVRNVRWYDQTHQSPQCMPPLTVGIKNYTFEQEGVRVFPNPANNLVTIQLDKNHSHLEIRLLDVCGRVVFNRDCSNIGETIFDLHMLDNGVYFIEITGLEFRHAQKLIINH